MAGKRLNVTRREFLDSYRRHYKLYKSTNGNNKARRLLLFYSVECGLKSLMMKNFGKSNFEEFESYCVNSNKRNLTGHDIKAMLKEINPTHTFFLQNINLKKGGSVQPGRFNELWRYGVTVADIQQEECAENTLKKIAEWIDTRV